MRNLSKTRKEEKGTRVLQELLDEALREPSESSVSGSKDGEVRVDIGEHRGELRAKE